MIIDLKHNKIIEQTMTESFERSFTESLLPKLLEKYGEQTTLVQMYEDHIADGFTSGGEFYYPLTVVKGTDVSLQWIKWKLSKGEFGENSPYAYLGNSLKFSLADNVPKAFEDKLAGRAVCAVDKAVKVNVQMMARDITFLSGRYSQSFVDEMARQLTPAIEKALSVSGVADSSLEICLVFSPESYMEHTSENVTYRRLLLTDNNGAPKDFWIKWTRLDGVTAYNVCANVNSENILFEIGEDVDQKIREKEYRFLLNAKGKDKYHNAMGRKNITEWRDVIKRLVKRGELVKIEPEAVISEETEALTRALADVLNGSAAVPSGEEVVASKESDEELLKILEFARERLDGEGAIEDEDLPEEELAEEGEELSELEEFYREDDSDAPIISFDGDEDKEELARMARESLSTLDLAEVDFADSEDEAAEDAEEDDEVTAEINGNITVVPEDPCEEEYCESEYSEIEDEEFLEEEDADYYSEELSALDGTEEYTEQQTSAAAETLDVASIEAKIRREVEAKLRLEYEMNARLKAEQEAERLRKENEKLQHAQRKQDDLRLAEQRARAEETERLRAQIEAQLRAESRERERLADAARAAVEEQRRLEVEKAKIERMRLEEERRLEAERQERELEAKRAAEVDRITRETEARIRAEYEARRAEEERLAGAEREAERRRAAEEAVRAERARLEQEAKAREAQMPSEPLSDTAAEEPASEADEVNMNYTYTSKIVKLLFRRSVDPNITARIHEVVKATLDYYGKSKMYLKVKATVPDSQTVLLNFIKIPMEEMELLGNIIKVLGNSGLGIAKAIVE